MINSVALERIDRILDLFTNTHNFGCKSSSDIEYTLRERLGYRDAARIMISHMLYGKNVVVENPPSCIETLFNNIILKAPMFRKMRNSLRYEFQAVFYLVWLLDALVAVMPGIIKFDKAERDSLVEKAKMIQAAIKSGDAVDDNRMVKITKRLQLLNDAEKNGGIISVDGINLTDAIRTFNSECFQAHWHWIIGPGRMFNVLGFIDRPVVKETIEAFEYIVDYFHMFEERKRYEEIISVFTDFVPNYPNKVCFIIDRIPVVDRTNDLQVDIMIVAAMMPFYLISNGINVAAFFSPTYSTYGLTEIDLTLESFKDILEHCVSNYNRSSRSIRHTLRDFVELINDPEEDTVFKHQDADMVMMSFENNEGKISPMLREECKDGLYKIPNLIHHVLNSNNIKDNMKDGFRRFITNEAR